MEEPISEREREAQTSQLAAKPGKMLCDYIRVVLPADRETWEGLVRWVGPWSVRAYGWHGYYDCSAHCLETGLLAWCRDKTTAAVYGVLVDLPGRACARLGPQLPEFLKWCLERGHATRVDWAIDDFDGRLTLKRILDAEAVGGMVSRWHGLTTIQNHERGTVTGWTVYMGSRKGASLVRVYNKTAEQRKKGNEAPDGWVRLEFQTNRELADKLARAYFREGSSAVIGQLSRRVRFAEPVPSDSNPRRWPVAWWWASVLGSVEPGPSLCAGEVAECTVARLEAYVERQAGPALTTVVKAHGGDLEPVVAILDRSLYRLKPKHYAALAAVGVGHE